MTREEAKEVASRWLPAWTGNRPNELIAYYSEDAFYSDPGIPNGAKGKKALLGYFRKLLAQNPNWVWTQIEGISMEDGGLTAGRSLYYCLLIGGRTTNIIPEFCTICRSETPKTLCLKGSWNNFDSQA